MKKQRKGNGVEEEGREIAKAIKNRRPKAAEITERQEAEEGGIRT